MSRLRVVTPPTVEPVSIADVKMHSHISHSEEDALIQSWIRSGRELAESYQRRAYCTQTLELSFDGYPEMPLSLPRGPLQSLVSVECTDYQGVTTTLYDSAPGGDTSMFTVDVSGEPGRIDLAYGEYWPSTVLRSINSVRVQFVAGYGDTVADVPENVKDAILIYCTYRYDNRAGQAFVYEVKSIPEAFYTLLRHDRCW
jgi:uncharacterized phiE125 gp8 family phage protein